MTSLESVVLPLEQSRSLVEHGIVLDTALSWYPVTPAEETIDDNGIVTAGIVADGKGDETEFVFMSGESGDAICPAPVLSEMTSWLMCHDCDDITFTNETADGENAVGARCNNSEGRNFEAHKADELLAAAALLMEVTR